jgi:DNA-binding NarL/FixJ family response regulator
MKTNNPTHCCRTTKRRILLIDDHPMTRQGLAAVINQQDDMIVCCQAGEASEGMTKMEGGAPELVITDISLDGKSGLELSRDVHAIYPNVRILVMSMHEESIYAERALRAGAHGYVMKKSGGEAILAAIRRVLSGKISVSDKVSALLTERFIRGEQSTRRSQVEALTDREFEVFKLIGDGCSAREVARRLHLSPKTVDVYRQHIKEKLGLEDSAALVQYAVRWVATQDR